MNEITTRRSMLGWWMGAAILALVLAAAAWMNSGPSARIAPQAPSAQMGPAAAPVQLTASTASTPPAAHPLPAPAALVVAPAAATRSAPSLPGARVSDVPTTDCKVMVQAHARASAACAGKPEILSCVNGALHSQGLNAQAYDLCKLFRPGQP